MNCFVFVFFLVFYASILDHKRKIFFRYLNKTYRVYESEHNRRQSDICNKYYTVDRNLKNEKIGFFGNETYFLYQKFDKRSSLRFECSFSAIGIIYRQ